MALLLIALGLVGVTGVAASAVGSTIGSTCDELSVSLSGYLDGEPNHVRITVGGVVKADAPFGTGFSQAFPFPDRTKATTWSVAVVASDDSDGSKGATFTRTGTSTPCAPYDACPYLSGNPAPRDVVHATAERRGRLGMCPARRTASPTPSP